MINAREKKINIYFSLKTYRAEFIDVFLFVALLKLDVIYTFKHKVSEDFCSIIVKLLSSRICKELENIYNIKK